MTPKPPMTEEQLNDKRAASLYWIEYLARVYDAKGKNNDKEAFNDILLQGLEVVAPSLICNETGKCRTMMLRFQTKQAVPVSKKGLHISVAKFGADIDYDAILETLNTQIDEMVLTEEIVFRGYVSPNGSLVVVSELSSVSAVSLLSIVDDARTMLKELDSEVTFHENHISLGHPNTRAMVIEYEASQQRTQASKTSWRAQTSEPLHAWMPKPSWRAPISGTSWRTKASESSRAQPSESSNVQMLNTVVWQ